MPVHGRRSLLYELQVPDTILVVLAQECVAVPTDRLRGLMLMLRPVPGTLSARAKIERALTANGTSISFDRFEKAALLDALNAWMNTGGFDALGPDLVDVRGALEYDLGIA
jgi:hypothetical protein